MATYSTKVGFPCPDCDKRGLRLITDTKEGTTLLVCIKCKNFEVVMLPSDLAEIIGGITVKAAEKGSVGVGWIQGFVEEKAGL